MNGCFKFTEQALIVYETSINNKNININKKNKIEIIKKIKFSIIRLPQLN